MGTNTFDTFSILHFASGIIAYYWGISLHIWIILNIIYEIFDNIIALELIGSIKIWPGGKKYKDNLINSFSDVVFGVAGLVTVAMLDILIEKNYTDIGFTNKLIQVLKFGKKNNEFLLLSNLLKIK